MDFLKQHPPPLLPSLSKLTEGPPSAQHESSQHESSVSMYLFLDFFFCFLRISHHYMFTKETI